MGISTNGCEGKTRKKTKIMIKYMYVTFSICHCSVFKYFSTSFESKGECFVNQSQFPSLDVASY